MAFKFAWSQVLAKANEYYGASEKQFDWPNMEGEEPKLDPTRTAGFDMVDAQRIMQDINERYEKHLEKIEEAKEIEEKRKEEERFVSVKELNDAISNVNSIIGDTNG